MCKTLIVHNKSCAGLCSIVEIKNIKKIRAFGTRLQSMVEQWY